jgi:NAD(P)-dependent dehydrogenase (short-subunit alcohol dehydrogenase family)
VGVLQNKVAIVTGGSSGIGRATALAMAREGARVVIADVNEQGAQSVVVEIGEAGGEGFAITTDVSEPAQLEHLMQQTIRRFGQIDILDNNAADLRLLAHDRDLLQTDIAVWEKTYRANQQSVMVACKYALPYMIKSGGGAIINISSVDGLLGEVTRMAYGMSKAAVNLLTLCIATTYGKHGVRCNAVLPGLVMTPMAIQNIGPDNREIWESNIPVPEFGKPEQIASVVVFLASDAASYINGELIRVDGGLLSHVPHLAQHQLLEAKARRELRG